MNTFRKFALSTSALVLMTGSAFGAAASYQPVASLSALAALGAASPGVLHADVLNIGKYDWYSVSLPSVYAPQNAACPGVIDGSNYVAATGVATTSCWVAQTVILTHLSTNALASVPAGAGVLPAANLPVASSSQFGAMKNDGTTLTSTAGVISVTGYKLVLCSNTSADTAALQAALNTGKAVRYYGTCYVNSTLTMTIPHQILSGFGTGPGISEIDCYFSSVGSCLKLTPVAGVPVDSPVLRDISMYAPVEISTGVANNVTKLVEFQSPILKLLNVKLINNSANGHTLYGDDEDSPTAKHDFGLQIDHSYLGGAGVASTGYVLRLGTYSQWANITNSILSNSGTIVRIDGPADTVSFRGVDFEDSAVTGAAVWVGGGSAANTLTNISVTNSRFERSSKALHVGEGIVNGLTFSHNNIDLGSGQVKATSCAYEAGANTAGATDNFVAEYNTIIGYGSAFCLADSNASKRFKSTKGNTLSGTDNFSTGTDAAYAYTTVMAPVSVGHVISGTVTYPAPNYVSAPSSHIVVPLPIYPHQYVDYITLPVGADNTVTATLMSCASGSTCSSGTPKTGTSTFTFVFHGAGVANTSYYMDIVTGSGVANIFDMSVVVQQ